MSKLHLSNLTFTQLNKVKLQLFVLLVLASLVLISLLGSRIISLAFVLGIFLIIFNSRCFILRSISNYKYVFS